MAHLAGHLELARGRLGEVLALDDGELIAALAGRRRSSIEQALARLDLPEQRRRCDAAGVQAVCRCDPGYPARLRELPCPPAVLHVAGGLHALELLASEEPVAIVGTRRPSEYGAQMARTLGRGLASAGIPVISGMAAGIDSAAHAGALTGAQAGVPPTVAILPGGAERPYPRSARVLHARVLATGAAISELPPGVGVRRWMFAARNRIIAALAAMTVVVEADERSGALITAEWAGELGRARGAVPGRVTSPQAAGPNQLLAGGATLVRGPQDVLDELFGAGVRVAAQSTPRPLLDDRHRTLLRALADGSETAEALARAGFAGGEGLAALSSLELSGYVRREPGGRYTVVP